MTVWIDLGTFDWSEFPKDFESKIHATETSGQFVAYSIIHYPNHKRMKYLTFREAPEAPDPFKEWNELAKQGKHFRRV